MVEPQLQSTLTCPHCGHQTTETMPTDACQYFYDCKGCGALLKPLPGDCCVFCSYGSVPCPPVQVARRAEDGKGCCGSLSAQASDDWVGNARTSLLAWWLPHTLVVAGLFAGVPARTAIWLAALVWMGTACILNARRSGRTHCRFTGPYYLAMTVPVLVFGSGVTTAGPYAWIALAVFILLGDKIIWWATERTWERSLIQTDGDASST